MLLSEYLECCTYFLTSCNNFVVRKFQKEKVNSKKQSHFNYSRSSNQKEEREKAEFKIETKRAYNLNDSKQKRC